MFKWSEIIEQNKEKLIEELERTFKDAADSRHMEYITEIYQDGTIRTWTDAAGSNSFSSASWNGESILINVFSFQYMDIEVTEEDFRRHMTEKEQRKVELLAKENGISFLRYVYGSGHHTELIEIVEQEWLDWYKDEYAYPTACEIVENKIKDEVEGEERHGI